MKGDLLEKLKRLQNNLEKLNSVAIGYSGGVDSTFLTKIANDVLGENAIAITARSSIFPKKELIEAKKYTKKIGIKHIIFDFDETKIKIFTKNPVNRCYFCKKELFTQIKHIAKENHISYVADGSNIDDESDYRPGMKALKEIGIISPLREVGLTKAEIKSLSKEMKIKIWDKPSNACLASRFPYGVEISKSRLSQVEKAEIFLSSYGIPQLRVRYHKDIARIEVPPDCFNIIIKNSEEINKYFKKLGFKYTTLDIKGFRTGSLNEVLQK